MFSEFSMRQFVSAFVVLFAVIDVLGSVPIILKLKRKGKKIRAGKIALWSFLMFIGFFYIGEFFLHLFKLDMSSFAIAGSLIIFVMAMEMILDIEIFREGPDTPKDSVFVPLVFPLIAGAGVLTTLLSIRAQFAEPGGFGVLQQFCHLKFSLNLSSVTYIGIGSFDSKRLF